jgi:RNA polymerase sigma-70 factor (ECF subfamily)
MTGAGVSIGVESAATSVTLLSRLKVNDPEAWARFVRLYGPLVYRWCRRAGLQEDNARDVGQEVFVAVARAIPGYEHKSFRGWLRTITDRKILDHRRKPPGADGVGGSDAQGRVEALSDHPPTDSAGPDEQDDRLLLLRQATDLVLATCQDVTRKAFLRVVIGEEDTATVAAELGLTENAVRLIKSRLLKRIREEFAELVEVPEAGDAE